MKPSPLLKVPSTDGVHLEIPRKINVRSLVHLGLAAVALVTAQVPGKETGSALAADLSGLPDDAKFFPIGIWMQSPSNAARYKEIGINTYVGLWKGPTERGGSGNLDRVLSGLSA
jgi:hypothetical protein